MWATAQGEAEVWLDTEWGTGRARGLGTGTESSNIIWRAYWGTGRNDLPVLGGDAQQNKQTTNDDAVEAAAAERVPNCGS